jgi:hypothetical protein
MPRLLDAAIDAHGGMKRCRQVRAMTCVSISLGRCSR